MAGGLGGDDFLAFVDEVRGLAEAAGTGNDLYLVRMAARQPDLDTQAYWAGVSEGQRVVAKCLLDILESYSDIV